MILYHLNICVQIPSYIFIVNPESQAGQYNDVCIQYTKIGIYISKSLRVVQPQDLVHGLESQLIKAAAQYYIYITL